MARLVSIGANLAQVPIALSHLGVSSYGLWVAIAGGVQMLNFADFGMGLGLQAQVSTALGQEDRARIHAIYATGFRVLAAVGATIALVAIPASFLLPWARWLSVGPELAPELPGTLAIAIGWFAVGLPISAGMRLATGLQLGWVVGACATAGSLLSLTLVVLAAELNLPLSSFVAVVMCGPVATNLLITSLTLRRLGGAKRGKFELALARGLLGQGLVYLVPQLGAAVVNTVPNLIVASALGPAAVVPYSVGFRISSALIQVPQILFAPLWPAYGEALSRGDADWMRRTFRRTFALGACVGPGIGMAMWVLGEHLVEIWIGAAVRLSPSLWLLFAAWTTLSVLVLPCTMLLNGSQRMRGLTWGGGLVTIFVFAGLPPLTVALGVEGAALGLLLAWLFGTGPLMLHDLVSLFRDLSTLSPSARRPK